MSAFQATFAFLSILIALITSLIFVTIRLPSPLAASSFIASIGSPEYRPNRVPIGPQGVDAKEAASNFCYCNALWYETHPRGRNSESK